MKKFLMLACAAFFFSCSSNDDESSNGGGGGNNNNTVAYIQGKMDGTAFDYTFNNTATDTYLYNPISGFSGLGFDRWYYYGGMTTAFNSSFTPSFTIAWNNMYFGEGGDESGETAAFHTTVGTLPSNFLTQAQDDNHMPGIEIGYEAANGNYYSSKEGIQTGSALSVSNYSPGTTAGTKTMTVTGTFSCKLYNDEDPTDVIDVTNGKFKLILSEFN
ncbi:hypothetical protein [Flavobacterium sp.]|uniref:hypothetical protein n=1 Tax=Flavobacterium sp. TaxID=239 RepID=UPI00120CF883|nr:hypothetical protein [Flavobacterium sp.]RZJ69985.1 MAG: hypothetical protein EOO49_15125 [Flavobacterium sp.]